MNKAQMQLYTPHTDLVMAVLRSPRIGLTPEPEAAARLSTMIQAVGMILDREVEPARADMMASFVAAQARGEKLVADLTWEEAGKALQDGAFGKYGEVYKVTPSAVYRFLVEYALGEEKEELSRKVLALRTDAERKRQERVAQFLADHSDYARAILQSASDNSQRKQK